MEPEAQTDSAEWAIGRLLNWTTDYLTRKGVEEPRLAAEVLLAHAIDCRRIDLYARFDQVLDEETLGRFREWVRRAAGHEPIAYLVGQKEFFSLAFHVTRDVLIPRPETEDLVECVIDHCAKEGLANPTLLDLGTGSGCIAVAILTQLPGATVVATDISAAALEVARLNGERHGVADRLTLVEADGLAPPDEVVPDGGFDILVSNPPYVTQNAVGKLHATVREHEPKIALTDGGDGLSFYRSIATAGPALLGPAGSVFVEIDDGKAQAVVETIEAGGILVHQATRRDRVAGHERVLVFSRKRDDG